MSFSSWDDEDRERYTPEAWAEVRQFMGDVFNEVDRPNDWLVRLDAELRGDEGGGFSWSFAAGLTMDQRRHLQRYLLDDLVRELEGPDLADPQRP